MSAGGSQVDAGLHHPERDVIRARGGVVHRRQGFINALPGSSVGYQGFPGGWVKVLALGEMCFQGMGVVAKGV